MSNGASGELSIDRERLVARIEALGEIGAIPGTTGCARLALTDEDKGGRDLVVTWMRDLGLDVTIDGIGNVIATMPGFAAGTPPVMTGSHIDTVGTGGKYDGNLGVLAGLEVIETVIAAGLELARPLAVGFFTDEEGARFPPDMLGSLVYVGGLGLEDALLIEDRDGAVVGEELDRIGYSGPAPVPGPTPHAFVELHIEQGPVLEDEDITIGVVEGVQGISWTELTLSGQSCHAGTTPMRLRHDPAYVASKIATFVRDLTDEFGEPQVGTVGAIDLIPNLVNVVPSVATITVDLRNTDEAVLQQAETKFRGFVAQAAEREGVGVQTRTLARFEPVDFDPRVIDIVERSAEAAGLSHRRMPSGAGHDAQMFARVCPTAMIFTKSVNGISHNVTEYTAPADLEAGADVLLRTMLALAETDF
ncbi:MAG: Zn-dependent hydrolase [Actinomycetota bacterium]|uniref:Zn-dependent hydrolase n=1 Tax=uncultured Ilumatobacter sp. TaxID=879968 RepID=UPI00374ED002|nr:Zn-dependent hydrolase [Actinomycetota bacterium]